MRLLYINYRVQAAVAAVVLLLTACVQAPTPVAEPGVILAATTRPYQPSALRAALLPVPGPGVPARPADVSATGTAAVLADVRQHLLAISPAYDTGTPQSSNAPQHLTARYGANAYQVAARPDSLGRVAWRVRWQLQGVGRAAQAALPATGCPDTIWQGTRLTYHRPAFDVVYDNTEAGVRQTLVLRQRPAGSATVPVQVALAVAAPGLHWQADGMGAVTFSQHAHPVLRYADLRCWDAGHRALPARLGATPGGALALIVDDAQATYPITIDPLASTTAATRLDGAAAGDGFGMSVANAGDVNGDGYGDVLVGAPNASPGGLTGAGSAYLYSGSATGLGTTVTAQFDGGAAGDGFGTSVAGAGDVNYDYYADVLVGAPNASPASGVNTGSAYFYKGSATGLVASSVVRLNGVAAGDKFGSCVAGIGDVSKDGYTDICIGAPAAAVGVLAGAGTVYLYQGSSTGVVTTVWQKGNGSAAGDGYGNSISGASASNAMIVGASRASPSGRVLAGSAYYYANFGGGLPTITPSAQFDGVAAGDGFGTSVAAVDDTNSKGSFLLIGAPNTDPSGRTDAGSVYVYRQPAITFVVSQQFNGTALGDNFGTSVAAAGDMDGDGYADIIVGAPNADPSGRTNAGSAYIYRGLAVGLSLTATAQLDGGAANNNFGSFVAGVGDVDGDGYGDVLAAALNTAPGTPARPAAGSTYLYKGSTIGLVTTATTQLNGVAASDNFGTVVAGAGDVNGDGFADVLVSAPNADPSGLFGAGSVYLYQGSATGLVTSALAQLNGTAVSDNFGSSMAGVGDVNGDGYADILIGAPKANPGTPARTDAGSAFFYKGLSTGVSTTASTRLDGVVAGDNFGSSLAGAGDVDADGYTDVLIGAPNTTLGALASVGSVYFYRGLSTGLAATATTQLNGTAANTNYGCSVAGAGDVNGDGFADVLVADRSTVNTRNSAGSVYLYRGSYTGLNTTVATQLNGTAAFAGFGNSMAGVGDVNGDSYDDVLIAAANMTPSGRSQAGSVFFYKGSASGLNTTIATQFDGATAGDKLGTSVAGAGDVNGDGYADVLIGAPFTDFTFPTRTDAGSVYCYQGSAAGLSSTANIQLNGVATNDNFGTCAAGVGDVDGDAYTDVLVGAPIATPDFRTNAGTVYFYRGNGGTSIRTSLTLRNADLTPLTHTNQSQSTFGIILYIRSPFGYTTSHVVWEAVANGTPFSNVSSLPNSTQSTGRGSWTWDHADPMQMHPVTYSGVVTKLGRTTRVRARVEYTTNATEGANYYLATGTGGVGALTRYGPWVYVTTQQSAKKTIVPLPVELSAFAATLAGDATVRLAWATASEKNSAAFEVERSTNGTAFDRLGTVPAAGISSAPRAYELFDGKLPAAVPMLYYRLRLVDADGTAAYSAVRSVTLTSKTSLALFPNPAHTAATLTGTAPGTLVRVFDALGRVVTTATADAAGTAALRLPTGLAAGVYVVRAGTAARRFVVE